MEATFTFLGSGTSRGVPMMCCDCPACQSTDPRDHHDRSAALITAGKTRILIDCGPELRLQMIRAKVNTLDAVLLTHPHADHLDGLDDLLSISQYNRRALPFYSKAAFLDIIRRRFDYISQLQYRNDGTPRWSVPQLDLRPVEGPFTVNDVTVTPLPLLHGEARTLGYRIGSMAYVCDCSSIPESTYPLLEGLSDLVIDALRWNAHPTHFNIFQAEKVVQRLKPRRAWFTHLSHDVLYARDQPLMQPGVTLAYDGLSFNFHYE